MRYCAMLPLRQRHYAAIYAITLIRLRWRRAPPCHAAAMLARRAFVDTLDMSIRHDMAAIRVIYAFAALRCLR